MRAWATATTIIIIIPMMIIVLERNQPFILKLDARVLLLNNSKQNDDDKKLIINEKFCVFDAFTHVRKRAIPPQHSRCEIRIRILLSLCSLFFFSFFWFCCAIFALLLFALYLHHRPHIFEWTIDCWWEWRSHHRAFQASIIQYFRECVSVCICLGCFFFRHHRLHIYSKLEMMWEYKMKKKKEKEK